MARRLTQQEFEKRVKKVNPNVKIIRKYKGRHAHIQVQCLKCGNKWLPDASSLEQGHGCPACAHRKTYTTKEFINRMYHINPNIKILGKYKNARTHIQVQCLKCGHKWSPIPDSLVRGSGCSICAMKKAGLHKQKTQAEFITQIKHINPNIKILTKYRTDNQYVQVQCLKCKHIWWSKPNYLINGYGCPKCAGKESKGERYIEQYLKNHHIKYKWQYVIPNCRYKQPLPFDFAVFNKNNTLNSLIELQGIQHYKPIKHFGGRKGLNIRHKRDLIKKNYCRIHHIKLIYICFKSNKSDYKAVSQIVNKTLNNQLIIK